MDKGAKLKLFLFGIEQKEPALNYRELAVLKHLKKGPASTKQLIGATGMKKRTFYLIVQKLAEKGFVKRQNGTYTLSNPTQITLVTKYEGIFFLYGLACVIAGFGFMKPWLGGAGAVAILLARLIRVL